MNSYIMYHCHSEYSLLDSCSKVQDYVDLAVRDGMKAISFSEHAKPLNWTEKWAACKKAGIRYIHSVEIYLTETLDERVRDNYHTVLMAKNMDGVRELNRLIQISSDKDHFYYVNRLSFDEFLNISDNIITTSACLASPLNKLPPTHPRYMELARKYTFFEVQAHDHPDQIRFNKRLYELSQETGKPLIAGTDTHSSSKYKAECRAVLLSAKHKSYGDEDAFDLTYKTYDELVEAFRKQNALPEEVYMQAIENTNLLYDMTEDIELDTSVKYPILYGTREADAQKFRETVETKFQQKLDAGIIPESQREAFRKTIDEEMRVFRKLDMEGFMLSMSELICWCKNQGMAIGTARGSVGGSRVAYVTDIIDLNPETWNTVFSRFANEDRVEPPDIDTDCVESDRPKIFKYIIDRFGINKTARVAAFGTSQDKTVIDDVGRHLAKKWNNEHPGKPEQNPWSLSNVARIKSEYDEDAEKTKKKYPQLFYYFDGLVGVKVSQSIHPAGIVISPITLDDNYGTFDKDGERCLLLDMDNVHEYAGLLKYDFLLLKTVQVIRDTCRYLGREYPKTYEINWDDGDVWNDMLRSPAALFQMEGQYAYDSLRKFKPKNIFDLCIVTACIRPSGASYRDKLLARIPHKNPTKEMDELLKNNLGYIIYQEDSITILQQMCGLTGSQADTVRRDITKKKKDKIEAEIPMILEGYCSKSSQPREIAEKEANEIIQVIQDSASYQFGYNHSVAYCLLTYLCAYYRYHHPLEFITSFLNNAANEDDIRNGTEYATKVGITVTMPKWGLSRSEYFYDADKRIIAKGLASIKYMSESIADELYELAHMRKFDSFIDLLIALEDTSLNSRQLDILIKIDFFSEFGNQRELLYIRDMFYDTFNRGRAKQIQKRKVQGTALEPIVAKYAVGTTKSGQEAKAYTILDMDSVLHEATESILALKLEDLDDVTKVRNFAEVMGYAGYVSGKSEDRTKLYVQEVRPLKRRKDGKQFGYSVSTKSIGSGIESSWTISNTLYKHCPIDKGDVVLCRNWGRDGGYYHMYEYDKL